MNWTALRITRAAMMAALLTTMPVAGFAQGGRGAEPARTAKSVAPIDVTGYWMSMIVDEWRFRVTPQKGDIPWMPLNPEARKVAGAWDPAKDEAEGKACKAYGAVGITQRPGRMHITWADDNTLKADFDTGTQTRLFHFSAAPADKGAASLQGYSAAAWIAPGNVLLFTGDGFVPALGGRGGRPVGPPPTGTLRVTTTNMLPGYVRKNGVPYSEKAVLTEHFNRVSGEQNDSYLVMTQFVDDPTYLNQPFIRTYTWKQVPDAAGWDPTPCLPR
jgi:hypothetical protein